MTSTDAERAARYRYAKRLEKTANKLHDLLKNAPSKYKEDFRLLPFDIDYILFDCVSEVLDAPVEYVDEGERVGVRFMLDMEYPTEEAVDEINEEVNDFQRWRNALSAKSLSGNSAVALKMTRNAFCDRVLGAELANSRWGWVGVKEGESGKQGALYLFGWEHNKGRDGEGTVGLFHKEVGVDVNGRRRPGHRDALEKIERVLSGELKPYIVWQTAEDPTAKRKTIASFNGAYVSECELYVDKSDWWVGRVGSSVSLPQIGS
ncbi:MAG: hypothetical protein V7720_00685 [Halioglobus sp.]